MAKITIQKMTPDEVKSRGIDSWPVWTKGNSRFDWIYSGKEECYIIEGEFTVETEEGVFPVFAGDFVTFADGLKCIWDISKPVKKYYNFP
jgi:uncharacterized cupin superfamily protein